MTSSSSSSTEKPENNMSFQLSPENVMKLKQSVEALCDSEFNPQGVAMLDVTEKGFEIMVRNNNAVRNDDAVGYIFLDASRLINFHCNVPLVRKMFSLTLFDGIFLKDAVAQGTSITVFHQNQFTTHLSFKYGKYPDQEEVAIEFYDDYDEFEKFPGVLKSCCKTVLGSAVLMEMIQRLQQTYAGLLILKLVLINISEKQVSILVKLPTEPYHYVTNADDDENFEATVEIPGKEYNALFKLFYLESMKKAASVAPRFHLHFVTKPCESFGNIMIQFNLGEVGKLVFIQKASLGLD